MSELEGKNTGNVIGGYKAALNNDNVSEEAKKEAEQKIEEIKNSGGDMSADYKPPTSS